MARFVEVKNSGHRSSEGLVLLYLIEVDDPGAALPNS
jgi:hypothetical protein